MNLATVTILSTKYSYFFIDEYLYFTKHEIAKGHHVGKQDSYNETFVIRNFKTNEISNLYFYHYCQGANWGAWGSSKTIAADGCFPTSLSMVISSYENKWITPDVICKYSGLYWDGVKFHKLKTYKYNRDYLCQMVCIAYGYSLFSYYDKTVPPKSQYYATDIKIREKVIQALNNGYLVIKRFVNKYHPNGHYCVIQGRKIARKQNYYLRDTIRNLYEEEAVRSRGTSDYYQIYNGNKQLWDIFEGYLGFYIIDPTKRSEQHIVD